jgi:hypothetical protein
METDGKTPNPVLHQGADSIFKITRPEICSPEIPGLCGKRVSSDNRGDSPLGCGQT